MDACVTLTKEICGLISNRLDTINEDYKSQLEKERVRETLNKINMGLSLATPKLKPQAQ